MSGVLPGDLRLGPVELTVSDLDRSVAFYQDAIGLRLHDRGDGRAAMGAGGAGPLVVLVEDPLARPAGRHAGLYHVALLHPSRHELARAALRLAATRTPIQGASDHGTHEAIYLADPDGNGLELAADRPRSQWPDLRYLSGPAPLDLEGLLAVVAGETPARHADPGFAVGHLHLHVGDTAAATAFYAGVVGFDVMTDLGSAVFVSAGGYHHHLAYNVWRGQGVGPVPDHVAGLGRWTVVVGEDAVAGICERAANAAVPTVDAPDGALLLRDPWGIALEVRPA